MFVDTHCHLDFLPQPAQQAEQARKQGVGVIVVPAVVMPGGTVVKRGSRRKIGKQIPLITARC